MNELKQVLTKVDALIPHGKCLLLFKVLYHAQKVCGHFIRGGTVSGRWERSLREESPLLFPEGATTHCGLGV